MEKWIKQYKLACIRQVAILPTNLSFWKLQNWWQTDRLNDTQTNRTYVLSLLAGEWKPNSKRPKKPKLVPSLGKALAQLVNCFFLAQMGYFENGVTFKNGFASIHTVEKLLLSKILQFCLWTLSELWVIFVFFFLTI